MEELEDLHRGLGAPLVYDHKLSAPRGVAHSAAAAEADADGVGALDDGLLPLLSQGWSEGERPGGASTATPLDASNKGFQLLQRMGWRQGAGLGRHEDGRIEPVAAGVEAGVRLGLGKQAEDDQYTAAEGITRRRLEVEIQAEEDPERRQRREAQAARELQIKADVTQILQTFFCTTCSKQYQTAMELEEHLSSYDHHHKKRLAEARAAEMERTRGERQRKEQRRQQREQQRLEEQIRKAQAAAGAGQQQQQQQPVASLPNMPLEHATHAAADGGSAGGWGWSSAPDTVQAHLPAPAPPPPPPPPPPPGEAPAGGWASAVSAAATAAAAPPPPPPPPPPDAAAAAAAAPPVASGGVKFGLVRPAAGVALAGRAGGLGRGGSAGLQAGRRPAMVSGRGRGGNAAAVFGASSSEDEA